MAAIKIGSVKGKQIQVGECVAQPGFGTIRTGKCDGDSCLVKWFAKDELDQMRCGQQLYKNLIANVEKEAPGKAWMWPEDVTEREGDAFGYVIRQDLSAYLSLSDLMEEKGNYDGWYSIVNAALSLITAFMQMEQNGYHMLYMTEDDIFIHPKTGRVLIGNVEFAGSGWGTWKPARVGRLVAPGYITGNQGSNSYMLAVLLFEILYLHHPLEGEQAAAYPVMDETAEKNVYGTNACFVYDEQNETNRPVRGIHINLIRRWGLYPEFVKTAFAAAFRQAVLKGKAPFVDMMEWYRIFMKLRSYIVPCSCGAENIWQSGEQKCRKCKNPLVQTNLYYRIGKDSYPVLPGTKLYRCQLHGGLDYTSVAGEFIRTKSNSSIFLLQNVTNSTWTVMNEKNEKHFVEPQETVVLSEGIHIIADGADMMVRSEHT